MPGVVKAYNLKTGSGSQYRPGTGNCIGAYGLTFHGAEDQVIN